MQPLRTVGIAMLTLMSACSNLDRSRNLANGDVPVTTTAQQVCGICHGKDGNATSPNFPSLAGQPKDYLAAQLNGFRSRSRADKAAIQYMWGLARNLTDAQIDGLATYYSVQTSHSPGAGNSRQVPAGKQIFESGIAAQNLPACSTCHGSFGEGSAIAPRLASQHAAYIVKQLQGFQNTSDRPNGILMKEACKGLTEQNMSDVAQYVQGMTTEMFAAEATNKNREQ